METLINMIGSVGFPIVACIYMFRIYEKQSDILADLRDAITKLTERLNNDLND